MADVTQVPDLVNQLAGQSSIGGAVILILWRVFSAYQKKSEKVARLTQEKTDRSIRFIEEFQKTLKMEMISLKRKIDEMQASHLKTQEHMLDSTKEYHSMAEAFKGYVTQQEPRLQDIEKSQSQLVQLSKELVLIRTKQAK